MARQVPAWQDSMSDGCSIQAIVAGLGMPWLAPPETPEQCKACLAHDRDYYHGGTRSHRAIADEMLRRRLIVAGMNAKRAGIYWIGCRLFGGPALHRFSTWACGKPVAWANGGSFFAYGEPAESIK